MMVSEAEMVAGLKLGRASAFDELVRTHLDGIYRFARNLTGNAADAEDLVQEIFLEAERSAKGFRLECSIRTWLHKIAYRRFLRLKSRHRKTEPLVEEIGADSGDAEFRIDLDRALAQLTPDHRAAFILAEIEQLDLAEVAAALDVPLGTVKSRLSRAKAGLRLSLEETYAFIP